MMPKTTFAILMVMALISCTTHPNSTAQAQTSVSAQTFEGNELHFIAGEFRAKWTVSNTEDKQWKIEDRFPLITEQQLLFLEVKKGIQRVSAIELDKLVTIQPGSLLFEKGAYPVRGRNHQTAPKSGFGRKEAASPMVVAMYPGNVVREEDEGGRQSLKALFDGNPISTAAPIRDYLKIRETEWLVYPQSVEMRSSGSKTKIFQCHDVFSIDVQNNIIAVGYRDKDNQSRVCVWKRKRNNLQNCDCNNALISLKDAVNPVLSQDGYYLAVGEHKQEGTWNLKVGAIKTFQNKAVLVPDIRLHDIKNKKVFYQNSYAWLGHTLFFTKGNMPSKLYQISCPDQHCKDHQPIQFPKMISVCGVRTWASSQTQSQSNLLILKYINKKLSEKNDYPLWFPAAKNCSPNDEKKYEMTSIKWGQPFLVDGKPYLATEARLKFMGTGGRIITRILVFAIQ
ncbi:secreted protein [Beggiatoa sp. PS]|nr:secreted protein [Beggiatoa sp. PS]